MILDTNALSAFVDGDAGIGEVLQATAAGCHSRHRATYVAWLEVQLPHFDILVVTDQTAVADAWIAALALQHRLPLLTRDGHFDAVPDLETKSW